MNTFTASFVKNYYNSLKQFQTVLNSLELFCYMIKKNSFFQYVVGFRREFDGFFFLLNKYISKIEIKY